MIRTSENLYKNGFLILNNCIDQKTINNIAKKMNETLLKEISHFKLKKKKSLTDNFNQLTKKISGFENTTFSTI